MTETPRIKTALLLDDERLDQRLYQRVIDRSGIVDRTIWFQYPDEALAFLLRPDRVEIDVIFLDINMPRMSGFDFLEKATEAGGEDIAKLVVVMLTTSLDPTDVARAKSFGVIKEFINKPLTVDCVRHVAGLLAGQTPAWSLMRGPQAPGASMAAF